MSDDLKWRRALDEEHKHLFASLERLEQTNLVELSDEEVFEHLHEVRSQLAEHFQTEEAAMQRDGFPEIGAHKGQHDMFLVDFETRIGNCPDDSEQMSFVAELLKHARDWLQRHLATQDSRYLSFLSASK